MGVKTFLSSKGTIALAGIVVLASIALLYGYSLEPKHVEFEQYRSPQEIDRRLQQLELETQKDPHNVNLQLELARWLVEKLKFNNIVNEFSELGLGPSCLRLYDNHRLWKRADSVLAEVLAADSLNTSALELRLINFRINRAKVVRWDAERSREKPSYHEETIPNTIFSLLRTNPHLAGEYKTFASMVDTVGEKKQKELLGRFLGQSRALQDLFIEHIRRDSPYSGEAWARLSKFIGSRDISNFPEGKKVSGLRAIRYGVKDRWNYLTNPYLVIREFDFMDLIEEYKFRWDLGVTRQRLKWFPGIAQFLFFHDISKFVDSKLSEIERREYIINDLIEHISEYPKLPGLYNLLISQYIKNKEYDSAMAWITKAGKEIPYFSLSNHHYYVYSIEEITPLLSLYPTNPILKLDSMNIVLNINLTENRERNSRRKGAPFYYPNDNIDSKTKETLLAYLEGLRTLDSSSGNYWGHLENKVRVMESLVTKYNVTDDEMLREVELSVFTLLKKYREVGYFPRINFTLPLYYATHGMEKRGQALFRELIASAPEITEDILDGVAPNFYDRASSFSYLGLTEGVSTRDKYYQSLINMSRGKAYLALTKNDRAISLLELPGGQDLYDAKNELETAYEKSGRYSKALELCDYLEQYDSKYEESYARERKASVLRKMGSQIESDTLFSALEREFPNSYNVYFTHAQCLYEMKEYNDALKIIELGIKRGAYDRYLNQLKDSVLVKMKM